MTREERQIRDAKIAARRKMRYLCFRLRTQAEGGAKAPTKGISKIKKQHTANPWFARVGGWANFATTWDLSEDEPFDLRPLEEGIWETWHAECEKNAIDIPTYEPKPKSQDARKLSEGSVKTLDIVIDKDERTVSFEG